jgi:Zn2+/Cd2+-exporting ATPase
LLIPATLFGWAGLGLAVLIHEGSTIVVVFNALRLLAYPAPPKAGAIGGVDLEKIQLAYLA